MSTDYWRLFGSLPRAQLDHLPGHLGMYVLDPDEVADGLPRLIDTVSMDETERAQFESTSQLLTTTYEFSSGSLEDLSALTSIHRRAAASEQGVFSIEC